MPSPTSSTRPTSRASSLERYWSISVCNTETISSALNLMTASRDDLVPKSFQLGFHRVVVQPVADLHHHATKQVWLDGRLQHRLLVEGVPQLLPQSLLLVVRQRHRAAHLHPHPAGPPVAEL